MPWLTALLILPAFTTLKRAKAADSRTVVILAKDGFTEDAMATFADADSVRIVALRRIVLNFMAAPFLPYFIDDNNYASCGREYDEAKRSYRRFLVSVFATVRRFIAIDAMITGNFAYAVDRELASAFKVMGIPFIALHKENLKTPGLEPFYERLYRDRRGPFTGHKVLVYNQIEYDLQLRSGVVASGADIEIVGMPRLDRMHDWRRNNVGKAAGNNILFFLFLPETGMPLVTRKTGKPGKVWFEGGDAQDELSLVQLSTTVCRALLRLAEENPDVRVIVKTKGRLTDADEIVKVFGVELEGSFPPNLIVRHGGDVLELIAEASVVCGFNSTALLEAMAAGKPVVLPWFAEAERPEVLPYVIDLRDVCVTAGTGDDLRRRLLNLAREPIPVPSELDENCKRTLHFWTGNGDGQAARRAREAVARVLNSASARPAREQA